ncbi:MAG: NAD(P)H-hydrate dehydratase [Anaerolineales bacterium]|nr:NAD(P)H-hydrate dehydratase [Anaerolineales bacterium]
MKYVSVEEMISIEKAANGAGHSYEAMMEAAGKGLADVIQKEFGHLSPKMITALVGSGNNGGDALVALDYLLSRGWQASALLFRKRSPQDPLMERVRNNGGTILDCSEFPQSRESVQQELVKANFILDGVLGTGIRLPIREPLDDLLGFVKEELDGLRKKPLIIAVDCPSGIDCDSGEAAQTCLRADLTVTMAAVKQGLLRFPAYDYVGKLQFVEIGLPDGLPEMGNIKREVIEAEWVKQILPERPLNAHKGVFGTALVIAGSVNYPGAAILAGKSAYRIGAGLVTMAVPKTIYSGVIGNIPEATWIQLDDLDGAISSSAIEQIKEALERPTACLIGPGLGTNYCSRDFLKKVLRLKNLPPLVLDADGLRLAASTKDWPGTIPAKSVLTPHPGEMSYLTGIPVNEIQGDRVGVAEKYAQDWDQILVLKGANTVIADPGGQTKILEAANPALSTAGSGDVLAGIITGLIAQGISPFEAAAGGAWIHARAGTIAAEQKANAAAVLAGEISDAIGQVVSD